MCFCEPRPELFSPQTAIILWRGFQPKLDQLPQWKRSEVAKTPLFGSKINNVANGGSYRRLTRKSEGFDVGENSQAKLDASATAGSNVIFLKVASLPCIRSGYISDRYFWMGKTVNNPTYYNANMMLVASFWKHLEYFLLSKWFRCLLYHLNVAFQI